MTLQEAKDQIARGNGFLDWNEYSNVSAKGEKYNSQFDAAAELYAHSKWDEAFDVSISKFEFAKTKAKTFVELVQLDAVLAILEVTKNTDSKP